jgi:hypothetical protein
MRGRKNEKVNYTIEGSNFTAFSIEKLSFLDVLESCE